VTPFEWSAIITGVGCAGSFYAGIRWATRHLPEILARASADQLRELARRTAQHR
jgi:hypothetical protein